MTVRGRSGLAAILPVLFLAAGAVWADDPSDVPTAELDLEQLKEVKVAVATRSPKPLSRAPAVASVITAEQIEAMGATRLAEVLERVPGLHVVPSTTRALDPVYSIRGVQAQSAAQVLVLINGVPITQALTGGPPQGFNLPVTGIARVEIVRGPGSAVYGADAFAGVIDVITKTAEDIDHAEVGFRAGSFDTQQAWLEYGGRWGGWDGAFTIDWSQTDGDDDRIVDFDQQTELDSIFGTDVSQAPGPLVSGLENVVLQLDLQRGGWTARLLARDDEHGNGAGISQSLDPGGFQESTELLADLTYETTAGAGTWELVQRVSHFHIDQDALFHVFPPGAVLPIGADGIVDFLSPNLVSFPDGLIARPTARENTTGLDSVAVFTGAESHRIRLNAGLELQDLAAGGRQNFGPSVIDGTQPVVDGTLTDVTGTAFTFIPDVDRDHWYVSFQDEWSILEDWELTLGARYDDYSDFDGTFNPRLALVWSGRPGLTAKLLYGSAFRAPSFQQLFARNNPAGLGNPDLDPETIETIELAIDCRPTRRLRTAFNMFRYEAKDLIVFVPDLGATTITSQNSEELDGYGFELEMESELSSEWWLQGSASWQHSEDSASGQRVPGAPKSQLFLDTLWRFLPDWSASMQINHVGERPRPVGDPGAPLDAYTVVDLSLRRARISQRLDVALIGRNLLDEEAAELSVPMLVDDYPIPGRAILIELAVRLGQRR